ncbi:MAG: 4-phosphoerythronate dehydrogenase PdxB [Phocaeicola sp.]
MKIVVDSKIPYIREALTQITSDVVYVPGGSFTPELVRDADVLITRTRTKCNRELLTGSRVKFIATATIGFDHIDVEYCREAGIDWSNCPGCNAGAVEQYIHSTLLLWQQKTGRSLRTACIGVVGVGHVGSRICAMAELLGMRVLRNDPPRQKQGEAGFVDLTTLAQECDFISFHTPLVRVGEDATFHLANQSFFDSLQRTPFLINTSRGEVIDTEALKGALANGQIIDAAIDVWENEPHIDLDLLKRLFITTPHIAGYSADGKANATRMALDAVANFAHLTPSWKIEPPALSEKIYSENKDEILLELYNPMRDSNWLKESPEKFEEFRENYPLRREFFDELGSFDR